MLRQGKKQKKDKKGEKLLGKAKIQISPYNNYFIINVYGKTAREIRKIFRGFADVSTHDPMNSISKFMSGFGVIPFREVDKEIQEKLGEDDVYQYPWGKAEDIFDWLEKDDGYKEWVKELISLAKRNGEFFRRDAETDENRTHDLLLQEKGGVIAGSHPEDKERLKEIERIFRPIARVGYTRPYGEEELKYLSPVTTLKRTMYELLPIQEVDKKIIELLGNDPSWTYHQEDAKVLLEKLEEDVDVVNRLKEIIKIANNNPDFFRNDNSEGTLNQMFFRVNSNGKIEVLVGSISEFKAEFSGGEENLKINRIQTIFRGLGVIGKAPNRGEGETFYRMDLTEKKNEDKGLKNSKGALSFDDMPEKKDDGGDKSSGGATIDDLRKKFEK